MAIAPVELRHVRVRRSLLFGYGRRAVNELLEQVADSFEDVWRERADLRDSVEHLEHELGRYRELEALLRETLLSAERSAQDVKEQAHAEAELVVREAHSAARTIKHDALAERERLVGEAHRVRALLATALRSIDEALPPVERAA
ncbi:MAG: DivIVA domain-containing protein [Actinomycetota bacterium]|nr:DivIVA domain-containing protein [Actinomycetota bacterium]